MYIKLCFTCTLTLEIILLNVLTTCRCNSTGLDAVLESIKF